MTPKFIREKPNESGFQWIWLYDKDKNDYFTYHNQTIRGKLIDGKVKVYGAGGGGETTVTSHTFYYYRIKAVHNSIDPSQPILCYNAYGELIYTVPPYYQFMDYGAGILSVPGTEKNETIESVATATYYVFYSTDDLTIDYENAEFKINKKLIKYPASTKVNATFEYMSVITAFKDVASVIDGRWDTQVQTTFFAQPTTGYNYAILDFGSIQTIQAMDIVAGFFKPDDVRRFDVSFNMTLQYSIDGINYYDIGDATHNFDLSGGESKSFEEEDLGIGFQTRYLKLILEDVKKIDFSSEQIIVSDDNRASLISMGLISSGTANGTPVIIREGIYVVAFTEISAYDDIILKSDAKLIPTTKLTEEISS